MEYTAFIELNSVFFVQGEMEVYSVCIELNSWIQDNIIRNGADSEKTNQMQNAFQTEPFLQ